MKKLLVLLLLVTSFSYSQQLGNPGGDDIYGEWVNFDGTQRLFMNFNDMRPDTFYRIWDNGSSYGEFEVKGKYIFVSKNDKNYKLVFHLKGLQFVVTNPDKPMQAFLFKKVSNKQLEPEGYKKS